MAKVILKPGDIVKHESLGEGVVTNADEEFCTVKFESREAMFRLPDAFYQGFLKTDNGEKNCEESSAFQDSLRSISTDLETARATLEQARDEEDDEEYLETIENAIDALDEAMDYLGEAIDHLYDAEDEEDELLNS